jgi:hypothetical protein
VVQEQNKVVKVSDGRVLARDIVKVRLAVWNLVEHFLEEHAESRVFLDGILELPENRHELLGRVGVDMLDGLVQVSVLVSPVLREPLAGTWCVVLVRHRVVSLVHLWCVCL